MSTKNLGQVAGLWIGNSAPQNTSLIWYDDTPAIHAHKVYNFSLKTWTLLDQNVISVITYSEIKNLAQESGLTQGSWYKITNLGDILALAITTTKIQYVDVNNNLIIDDLASSVVYTVNSTNLLVDDIQGVWDDSNKRLKFSFLETSQDDETKDDFILGKKRRNNVWSLAKYKLSSLVSAVAGNSISWNRGLFFNFKKSLADNTGVEGGVVGFDEYDRDKADIQQSIDNVATSNTKILEAAKEYADSKVASDEIYNKILPTSPTAGVAVDVAQGDTLSTIVNKFHRWITQFKVATGIKVSPNFAPAAQASAVNNNDTVDSALRKIQKNLDNMKEVSGENVKVGITDVQILKDTPTAITKNDTIKQAIQKLIYWVTNIINEQIKPRVIQESRLAVGVLPTDFLRVDIQSSDDLTGCGFGAVFSAGNSGYFVSSQQYPNNPYRINSYFDSGHWDLPILGFCPVTQVMTNDENQYSVATPIPHYKGHLTESEWDDDPDYLVGAYLQVMIHLSQSKYNTLYNSGKRYMKITVTSVDVYGATKTPSQNVIYLSLTRVNIWGMVFNVSDFSSTSDKHIIIGWNIEFTKTNTD